LRAIEEKLADLKKMDSQLDEKEKSIAELKKKVIS